MTYAKERETFGKAIIDHQGLAFVLADMAAAVESARATYLAAARLKDAGRPFARQASIAKLVATDNAMKVTTDAVQVLGGAGYTKDFPVERYMREAKVMQIFEGTNQIQRLVISRDLAPTYGQHHGPAANTAALVTGGASGLGAATAAALAARGASVYALDLAPVDREGRRRRGRHLRRDRRHRRAPGAQRGGRGGVRAVCRCVPSSAAPASARRPASWSQAGSARPRPFRQGRPGQPRGLLQRLTVATEAIAQTDADANGQRGVIVNTASIAAYDGQVGQVAYAVSKGGIVGLTLPAARDLAQYGIRVCTIAPGIVDTPMLATVSRRVPGWPRRRCAVPAAARQAVGVRGPRRR